MVSWNLTNQYLQYFTLTLITVGDEMQEVADPRSLLPLLISLPLSLFVSLDSELESDKSLSRKRKQEREGEVGVVEQI